MPNQISNPLALIAELTHRCPLHCVYCSNPLEMHARANELSTETWTRVFKEAPATGVLQAAFTGVEPLARAHGVALSRAPPSPTLSATSITPSLAFVPVNRTS